MSIIHGKNNFEALLKKSLKDGREEGGREGRRREGRGREAENLWVLLPIASLNLLNCFLYARL